MAGQKSGIGASLTGFLKATIVGGILFLLPLGLIVIVLGHAMRLAAKVAEPISKLLPIEATNPTAVVTLLAIFLLVVISLVAGLIARTNPGHRLMRWFEDSLFGGLPQYQMVVDENATLKISVIRFFCEATPPETDEAYQIK